jgi:phosphatidate phosphatase APP1
MADWQERIAPAVRAVEKRYDALKYRLYYALGGPGPMKIEAYRGFGNRKRLYLSGRVLEERGIRPPRETDTWWDNFVNMYKRLNSREIPHARLVARFQDVEQEVVADDEGMFDVWIEPSRRLAETGTWESVELELIEPVSDRQSGPVRTTANVLIPEAGARFGVISDIDDTVIQSEIGNLIEMVSTVLFSNAQTRLPLPGVAALYRALHAGRDSEHQNPMFYVSNGLWNLYDLLEDFFELNHVPGGSVLLLRNWGIYEDQVLPTKSRGHKEGLIRSILDLYRDLPFILIGDSGEADPEIYDQMVDEYGERILAVYIRNVSRELERPEAIRALADDIVEAGSELVLADDSLSMARHAVKRGWIAEEALEEIAAEQSRESDLPASPETEAPMEKDREVVEMEGGGDGGGISSALEEADGEEVPTVVVKPEEDG